MRTSLPASLASSLLAALAASAALATPPPLVNYQGVLRDAANKPRNGSFDMVFRFYSQSSSGDEILLDAHLASGGQAVAVSNGLFDVTLGGGSVSDGSGPGSYPSLAEVFRDYGPVWLQIEVGPPSGARETLLPRVRIVAAAYAMNALRFDGRETSNFVQTNQLSQTKSGPLGIDVSASPTPFGFTVTGSSGFTAGSFYNGFGYAELASGASGVYAVGDHAGVFEAASYPSRVELGAGNWGIAAQGAWGGSETSGAAGTFYVQGAYTGTAEIAVGDTGMLGRGSFAGGIFRELDSGAQAYLAYNNTGVAGYARNAGENPGYFEDTSSGLTWAAVGQNGFKIKGTGAVSFVQNHPGDPGAEIVYTAPEGEEAAVYTRGWARLVDGVARVPLGATFHLVANPDIGLTAHLTPRGDEPIALSVASLSSEELVVRGPAGSDAAFDYLVWGLRIGFEERPAIRPKERSAPIPSFAPDEALLAARPDLRATTPLARFAGMREEIDRSARPLDLSRSRALAAAIGAASLPDAAPRSPQPGRVTAADPATLPVAAAAPRAQSAERRAPARAAEAPPPVVEAFPAGALPAAVLERVEAGDLLAADALHPGALVRAVAALDPAVAGIVAGEPDAAWSEKAPLAFAGTIVFVKADATAAPIAISDLLVSSSLPGYAMRAPEGAPAGTIVAKALEGLPAGTGRIRVLVMSR